LQIYYTHPAQLSASTATQTRHHQQLNPLLADGVHSSKTRSPQHINM